MTKSFPAPFILVNWRRIPERLRRAPPNARRSLSSPVALRCWHAPCFLTPFPLKRFFQLLLCATALWQATFAGAVDVVVTGAAGANGTAGDPGTQGTAGARADAAANSGDATNSATATGGRGGDGGDSTQPGTRGGNGGDGGEGAASARTTDGVGPVTVSAFAAGGRGGDGGSGGAGGVFGRGGNGGYASIGQVYGSSSTNGPVLLLGEARGGDAGFGDRLSTEYYSAGGVGGEAYLANAVSGATSGALTLRQNAYGGNGGSAKTMEPGRGGGGQSSLQINSTTNVGGLLVITTAGAGAGGDKYHSGGVAGEGGRASIFAIASNTVGPAQLEYFGCFGGAGGRGIGGADGGGGGTFGVGSEGAIEARTSGDDRPTTVGAGGEIAIGGDGGSVYGSTTTTVAGVGGRSYLRGEAHSTSGNSAVFLATRTQGGVGGSVLSGFGFEGGLGNAGAGGEAKTWSVGTNTGNNKVTVTSEATGGAGGTTVFGGRNGNGGNATAYAEGRGYGLAEVTAKATGGAAGSGALGGTALADAYGGGVSGFSSAIASTQGDLLSLLLAEATASLSNRMYSGSRARTYMKGPLPTLHEAAFFQTIMLADGLPGREAAEAAVAGNPILDAAFDFDRATGPGHALALAAGVFGGNYVRGTAGTLTYTSSLTLQLDAPALGTGQLRLALLDSAWEGNGFTQLHLSLHRDGSPFPVIDHTFTNVADAASFFDDRNLFAGWNTGDAETIEVVLSMELTIADVGDGFRANFLVVSVPEPSSGLLVLVGAVTGFASCRRRRRP
jgi:hypothetical protein